MNTTNTFIVRKVRRIVWGLALASYVPWIYVSGAIWGRPTLGQSVGTGALGVVATAFVISMGFGALQVIVEVLSTDNGTLRVARRSGVSRG